MLSPDEDAIRMFHRGNSTNQAATRRKLSANSVFQCLVSSDSLAVVVDQRTRAVDQSPDFLGISPNRRDRDAHFVGQNAYRLEQHARRFNQLAKGDYRDENWLNRPA